MPEPDITTAIEAIVESKIAAMLADVDQYSPDSLRSHVAHLIAKLKGALDDAEPIK